jgi:penicillin-insensitive murein DD-endopeptidase
MMRRSYSHPLAMFGVAAALAALLPAADADANPMRTLPKEFRRAPYTLMSLSVGHPNQGWQVRAKKLRGAPYLQVKPNSIDHAYGHPALVLMLQRSAKDIAQAVPGSVLMVGDLSSEDGGPLAGHRSHQSGRDADVGFYVRDARGQSVVTPRFLAFDGDGKAKNGSGLVFDEYRNWLLVQSWVRDDRAGLSHIFVSRPLRERLLAYARRHPSFSKYVDEVAVLLKQPKSVSAHDDHFHVRISCPRQQEKLCREHSR